MTEQDGPTPEPKKIIIKGSGIRWTATFKGEITRREINRIRRIIQVEYARHERTRNVQRKMERMKAEAEEAKAKEAQLKEQNDASRIRSDSLLQARTADRARVEARISRDSARAEASGS